MKKTRKSNNDLGFYQARVIKTQDELNQLFVDKYEWCKTTNLKNQMSDFMLAYKVVDEIIDRYELSKTEIDHLINFEFDYLSHKPLK